MKEIKDIIAAYQAAVKINLRTALATVVHVEGSSYRRPGARMLVTENGNFTGAISGGCLEGDVLRKAQLAIHNGKNKLVTYDTSDEDDVEFGVQLGCNGIIHILFEPIVQKDINSPINILTQLLEDRNDAVILTLFNLGSKFADHPGTCLLLKKTYLGVGQDLDKAGNFKSLVAKANDVLASRQSEFAQLHGFDAFFEFIPPPVHLVIAGAGNDVIPLTTLAKSLGWQITILDGRYSHATINRFPLADNVHVIKPEEIAGTIHFDQQTVCVLMTHNYQYDLACMKVLIQQPVAYIGTLGPRKKLDLMLDEISSIGLLPPAELLNKIHGPVGIDIGAETSEEIAISIMAEILAVINRRNGTFLKDKNSGIHERETEDKIISAHKTTALCAINEGIVTDE